MTYNVSAGTLNLALSIYLCVVLQVPFATMLALLCMWMGISVPLVFLGYFFGFRKEVTSSFSRCLMLLLLLGFDSYLTDYFSGVRSDNTRLPGGFPKRTFAYVELFTSVLFLISFYAD